MNVPCGTFSLVKTYIRLLRKPQLQESSNAANLCGCCIELPRYSPMTDSALMQAGLYRLFGMFHVEQYFYICWELLCLFQHSEKGTPRRAPLEQSESGTRSDYRKNVRYKITEQMPIIFHAHEIRAHYLNR